MSYKTYDTDAAPSPSWERWEEVGILRALVMTFGEVLFFPYRAFRPVTGPFDFLRPLQFAIIMAVAGQFAFCCVPLFEFPKPTLEGLIREEAVYVFLFGILLGPPLHALFVTLLSVLMNAILGIPRSSAASWLGTWRVVCYTYGVAVLLLHAGLVTGWLLEPNVIWLTNRDVGLFPTVVSTSIFVLVGAAGIVRTHPAAFLKAGAAQAAATLGYWCLFAFIDLKGPVVISVGVYWFLYHLGIAAAESGIAGMWGALAEAFLFR